MLKSYNLSTSYKPSCTIFLKIQSKKLKLATIAIFKSVINSKIIGLNL